MNLTDTLFVLRSQRDDLDQAIRAIEAMASHWGPPSEPRNSQRDSIEMVVPPIAPCVEKPPKSMTGWEACRLVLRRCGEAMSVPQVVAALEAEGIFLGSRDRRAYVSTTLRRREDIFYRTGEGLHVHWGLTEWTPRKRS